jgi:sugar-specific transcriptional regulator TrmB
MKKDIEEAYQQLGLNGVQARVLGVLALSGVQGASGIAKQLGMSRSSVYTVLSTLIAEGFVSSVQSNGVQKFSLHTTEGIAQFVEAKKDQVQKMEKAFLIIKEYASKSQSVSLKPSVQFFEGQEGMKRAYLSMLRDAREGDVLRMLRDEFAWSSEWSFVYEEAWLSRVARWKKEKNIRTKLLINDSTIERSKRSFYQNQEGLSFRYIPQKSSVASFASYTVGHIALLLSFEGALSMGIVIRNKVIAENNAIIFNALWEQSK